MSRKFTTKKMQIGELSRSSGFSPDTLRYYEKMGILRVDRKNNSYREYDNNAHAALEIVHLGKDLGFKLSEIKNLVDDLVYKNQKRREIREILENKFLEIERKIEELNRVKAKVSMMIEAI